MVQCEKLSNNKSSSYGKSATEMKPSNYNHQPSVQKSSSPAKDAGAKNGSWGQFKNQSHFKSLHHC